MGYPAFRIIAYVGVLVLLVTGVQAAVLERQIDTGSTTGTIEATGSSQSPTSTVTTYIIITSTAPLNPSPTRSDGPSVSTFVITASHSGHITLSTATVTLFPEQTSSIPHRVSTPFVPSVTQPADEQKSSNKGAITGGVLGALAIIVAAFAAFVWFRRRSPKHWRNRVAGRWQNFDSKDFTVGGDRARPIYVGEPVYGTQGDFKQADPNPLPPLYIRDRQTAADLFGGAPGSSKPPHSHTRASSSSNMEHHRRESSNFGRFDLELQSTSPK